MKKIPQNKINKFYLDLVLDHICDESASELKIIDGLLEVGFIKGPRPRRIPKNELEGFLWRLVYYMHNYNVCSSEDAITINWDLYLKLVADLIFQPMRNEQDFEDDKVYAQLFLEFIDLYYLGGYPSDALISLYHYTTSKKDALKLAKTFIPNEDLGWAAEFIMSLPAINEDMMIS